MGFLRSLLSKPTTTTAIGTVFRSLNPKNSLRFSSNSSEPPLEHLVNDVSRVLSDHRNPQDDLELSLSSFATQISTSLVEQVLKRCKNLSLSSHRFFLWAKQIPGFEHSQVSFRILVDVLGQGKQFAILWDLLIDARDSASFDLGSDIFWLVFRAYSRANQPRDAVRAFNRMAEFRIKPTTDDLDELLYTLSKRGHVRHAAEFFDRVKSEFSPTAKTYTVLIRGWGDSGDAENARRLFDEMRAKGIPADTPSYDSLVEALFKGGLAAEAYEVFKGISDPSASTYSILVRAHADAGEVHPMLRALDSMRRRGLVPNTFTYNRAIKTLCRRDQHDEAGIDEAYNLLDEMAENDLSRPDTWSYNTILSFHCNRCEVSRALRLLSRMERDDVAGPDMHSYNMVLRTLVWIGRFDRASEVWKRVTEKGSLFKPSVSTYSVMIHGLLKKKGKTEEACRYFEAMVDHGIPPYDNTVEILRERLLGLGLVNEVEILASKMDRSSSCSIREMARAMRGDRDFVKPSSRRGVEIDVDIDYDYDY